MAGGPGETDRHPTAGCSRRRVLRTLPGLATCVGLAGCGRIDRYEFRARPVVLPAEQRSDLGYRSVRRDTLDTEHSGTVGGVSVVASVETEVRVYESSVRPVGDVVSVGAASTPEAAVGDEPLNPLSTRPLADLLTIPPGREFLERTGLRHVGHQRATVRWERGPTELATADGTCLGRATTLYSYAGVLSGTPSSVALVHLTRVNDRGTVIPALVHGQDVDDPGRPLVGPDGYLDRETLEGGLAALGTVSAALAYAAEPARE